LTWGHNSQAYLNSSVVLDHITKNVNPRSRAIAYHYCDYQYQKLETAEYLLRSLAKQVASRIVVIPEDLVSLYKAAQMEGLTSSLDDLTNLLTCLCQRFADVFVVIDGLDENLHRHKLIPILKKLEDAAVRVFVTSRRLPDLQEAFGKRLNLEIKAAASDVKKYVASRFDEIDEIDTLTFRQIWEDVADKIVCHANGM
jgi:hypothetical protein